MPAFRDDHIRLDTPVQKLTALALGGGGVIKRVPATVVGELILTDVGIDGEERVGIDGVLVRRGDAPGQHPLTLVLSQLIIRVGDLDPVPGGKKIEVEGVFAVGLEVEAIEDGLIVACVVDGLEFRGVEETVATDPVERGEVAEAGSSEAKGGRASGGTEGAEAGVEAAEDTIGTQAGACGDFNDKAGLVAKLGTRVAGDEFEALDGAGGELGGEHFALLVADRLAVHDEADLGVIAEGMEEAIAISHNSTRTVRDGLTEAAAGICIREFGEKVAINVGVCGGVSLQHVVAAGFDS